MSMPTSKTTGAGYQIQSIANAIKGEMKTAGEKIKQIDKFCVDVFIPLVKRLKYAIASIQDEATVQMAQVQNELVKELRRCIKSLETAVHIEFGEMVRDLEGRDYQKEEKVKAVKALRRWYDVFDATLKEAQQVADTGADILRQLGVVDANDDDFNTKF